MNLLPMCTAALQQMGGWMLHSSSILLEKRIFKHLNSRVGVLVPLLVKRTYISHHVFVKIFYSFFLQNICRTKSAKAQKNTAPINFRIAVCHNWTQGIGHLGPFNPTQCSALYANPPPDTRHLILVNYVINVF